MTKWLYKGCCIWWVRTPLPNWLSLYQLLSQMWISGAKSSTILTIHRYYLFICFFQSKFFYTSEWALSQKKKKLWWFREDYLNWEVIYATMRHPKVKWSVDHGLVQVQNLIHDWSRGNQQNHYSYHTWSLTNTSKHCQKK